MAFSCDLHDNVILSNSVIYGAPCTRVRERPTFGVCYCLHAEHRNGGHFKRDVS